MWGKFNIEVLQLIDAERMIKLENHCATPNEITDSNCHQQMIKLLNVRLMGNALSKQRHFVSGRYT